uniref:RRM domain-containing protein n=1 Tax=Chaetoceros debilis TaxID=122233 RepID=A0A7S3QJZ2_9STRA|mmetsp:Transcript_13486/g.20056  ORF Transcript_13486/g.20056 Transcript_13486/m.20056 type:complete len:138 (-) Transcript_13486:238-651(-)|eukprot:CAMPEP_0194082778 /NCGR_PEP_ID=MMETSP0149-20130528/8201_1 /TAXON_ID=122233 /ORGANISM="Chaetoceros debilis, Strain MM31A-1" /LENGTH=137 /DNA_ID=CAMNT_0038765015 /DNA_START=47 /DNA_END=460 /DNA_ORIENTATION=+
MAASSSEPVLQSRRSLYVGGLADEVKETNLRATLIPFGPLKSIDIPMDYASGKHKGFAFVEYIDGEDASEAIYNLDGSELYGRVLNVNLAQHNQNRLSSNKAVWSTDEFFQNAQAGTDNAAAGEKANVDSTLREDGR